MTETNNHIFGTDPAAMRLLRELRSLNQQFIAMLCATEIARDEESPLVSAVDSSELDHSELESCEFDQLGTQLRNLNEQERDKIAGCPYALFDLDLCNSKRWSGLLGSMHNNEVMVPSNSSQFILAALCFAQRLAQDHADLGILLLGMNASVCLQLQESTIGQLMTIAQSKELSLQPRLSQDPNFWPDLVNFVHEGTPEQYLAAQTCALQLVAAGST